MRNTSKEGARPLRVSRVLPSIHAAYGVSPASAPFRWGP